MVRTTLSGLDIVAIREHSANVKVRSIALALGVPQGQIVTRSYWKPGRVGLEYGFRSDQIRAVASGSWTEGSGRR